MKTLTRVLASILIASAAVAQATVADTDGQFAAAFQHARRELLAGNYLTAVALVRPFALTQSGEIKDDGAFQAWDQMQAMVSGAPSLLKQDVDDPPDRQTLALVAESTRMDALQAIVVAARRTRVVMLNENHRTPYQRIFAARLAQALRPLGYDTLAMEALATRPASVASELKRRGYPVLGDGFYIRDPAFGFFVRRSLELGYTPLAYEADPPDGSDPDAFRSRERGQAMKLLAYLRAHPQAKLLVYGGGGALGRRAARRREQNDGPMVPRNVRRRPPDHRSEPTSTRHGASATPHQETGEIGLDALSGLRSLGRRQHRRTG